MKTILLIALIVATAGCGTLQSHERTEILMGTTITLKAEGGSAQAAIDESFTRIDALIENIFADVKRIEDAAGTDAFVAISPDVYEMLQAAQICSERTGGAFDVTCGAAIKLWGAGTDKARVPSAEEIAAVKNLVGYKHLHLRDGAAYLDLRGVKINLGGVAKGYGVDLVREIFARHGVEDGLIDFGTSTIYALGKKQIGIKNARGEGELAEVIELENAALSTSGDYEKYFIVEGKRRHHIIDPVTCEPAESNVHSVSVVVDGSVEYCAMLADILSTAVFVAGKERAEKFLTDLPAQVISWQ